MGDIDCPKVIPYYRGLSKLSKGLLSDCERRPRKSASFLLYESYHNGDDGNGIFPFSLTGFLKPYFLVFYEEERIK